MNSNKTTKKPNGKEIGRFVIVGVVATIVDFLFYTLTSFLLQKAGLEAKSVWCTVISTIIGFIIGVIVNYILSIIWVYQDYDKEKTKEHRKKHILIFFILSSIGMLIGVGVMAIFKVSFQAGLNIDIDTWMNVPMPPDISIWEKLSRWITGVFTSFTFWMFFIAFVVKTLFTLAFNYITRKKFLFKDKPQEIVEEKKQ